MNTFVYKYDEIFEDNPDDPSTVLMTIPEEIRELMKLENGDLIIITVEDNTIIMRKNG